MDEKLVEQISTATGVPQELVSRSAQARAEANGVDINAILNSWSSGEAPSVSSTPVETVVEEAPVETVVEEAPVETVVEEAPVETMVDYVDEDVVPPAQLGEKIFRALQYGAIYGIVAAFIQAFIVSSYLYEGLILEAETLNLISNYVPTQYILNIALTTTLFAIINSVNLKKVLEKNKNATILIVNSNFGCGSSREHAPQALMRWGIKAIIGESFADIFYGNCIAIGIPCFTLPKKSIEEIQDYCDNEFLFLEIDLKKSLAQSNDLNLNLEIRESSRKMILSGEWDATSTLLDNKNLIENKFKQLPYIQFNTNFL